MPQNITIPKGKKITIEVDDTEIPEGIPLILEDNVTLSASSQFGSVFGGGGKITQVINAMGKLSQDMGGPAFGGTLKQMGMQTWQSTDPLTVSSLVLTFYLGIAEKWDAFEEVKKPIFELMKMTLPKEGVGGSLTMPGPSPLSALKGTFAEGKVEEKVDIKSISLDLGGIIYLPEIIVKKVDPTFSVETDDKGNPIWGQVSIDIQTLFTATSKLLEDELIYEDQTLSSGGGSTSR